MTSSVSARERAFLASRSCLLPNADSPLLSCMAQPAARICQHALAEISHTALKQRISSLNEILPSHLNACAITSSSTWFSSGLVSFAPTDFAAAMRARLLIPEKWMKANNLCAGCNRTFPLPNFLTHITGCANRAGHNCSKVHSMAKQAFQRLSSRAAISWDDEPRYSTGTTTVGPDLTLYLPDSWTVVDLKGTAAACDSHCRQSLAKVWRTKYDAAHVKYDALAARNDEVLRPVGFEYNGGLSKEAMDLVHELTSASSLDPSEEAALITAEIVKGVARTRSRNARPRASTWGSD